MDILPQHKKLEIAEIMISWYKRNGRKFPWRDKETKPYAILIAEMMLQRTRAQMVVDVYSLFLEKYPDIKSLSKANINSLSLMLKPLGLHNRRAYWMKRIAELLVQKYGSEIPQQRQDLEKLPGLGTYIVNAILCFAFGKKVPIVDSNVARIFSRLDDIKVKHDLRRSPELHELAKRLIPTHSIKEYNWAILDLGATICTPKNPQHNVCPLQSLCIYSMQKNSKIG